MSATKLVATSLLAPTGIAPNGAAFSQPPILQAQDAGSVLDPTFTGTVTATLNVLSGAGSLTGTTAKNAVGGICNWGGTTLAISAPTGGSFTITFSASGLTSYTTPTITVATKLTVTVQPGDLPSGTGATAPSYVPMEVQAQTAAGVLVAGYGLQYSAAIAVNAVSGGAAVVSGADSLLFYGGKATFRGIAVRPAATGVYNWTVSSPDGLTSTTSANFAVTTAVDTFYPTTGPVRAALPRTVPDVTMPVQLGTIRNVGAGQTYTTIQAALNAATFGDRVILKNGNTFVETVTVPLKTWLAGWITIESETLPCADGVRCKPADFTTQATWTSVDGRPVLTFANGMSHVRCIGIQWGCPNTRSSIIVDTGYADDFTTAGGIPTYIIIDRCKIVAQDGFLVGRGIRCSAQHGAVINCHIANIHDTNDCQAITIWSSPGDVLIRNNYMESSGENFMTGGNGSISEQYICKDVTFTQNHVKKLKTRIQAGTGWTSQNKNLFELKEGHRILVEGNVFDGFWDDMVSQPSAFNLKSVNQYDNAPYTGTSDVVVRNNILRNVAQGFAMAGHPQGEVEVESRIAIRNNVVWNINEPTWQRSDWTGFGQAFVLQACFDVLLDHMTFVGARPPAATRQFATISDFTNRTTVQNLLFVQDGGVAAPVANQGGSGHMNGSLALDPAFVWRKNVVMDAAIGWANFNTTNAPAGNVFVEVDGSGHAADPGFVNLPTARTMWETGDPLLVLDYLTLAAATTYKGAGCGLTGVADSSDIGAFDIPAIQTAITGVVSGVFGPATATKLAVSVQPSAVVSGTPHATQLAGTVQDASSATVTTDASTVTAALVVTSGTATATGTRTTTVVSGAWAFTSLGAISNAGAVAHWHVTDGSLTAADSASFPIAGRRRGRRVRV